MCYPLSPLSMSNTLHTFEQHMIHSHFWATLSYRQWISNVQHVVSKQTSELSSKTTMPAMLHWQRFAHRSRFMWLLLHSIVFCSVMIYICIAPVQVECENMIFINALQWIVFFTVHSAAQVQCETCQCIAMNWRTLVVGIVLNIPLVAGLACETSSDQCHIFAFQNPNSFRGENKVQPTR